MLGEETEDLIGGMLVSGTGVDVGVAGGFDLGGERGGHRGEGKVVGPPLAAALEVEAPHIGLMIG